MLEIDIMEPEQCAQTPLTAVDHSRWRFLDIPAKRVKNCDETAGGEDLACLSFAGTNDGLSALKNQVVFTDPLIDARYFKSYSFREVHALMLSDTRRTLTYRLALTEAHKRLAGETLLDVGCGTGILAMFAVKAGSAHVIAVDAATYTTELARRIINENQLGDRITVVNSRIEEACLDVKRVGAIVSEWMGYCLLYENMLTSVLFARDKYLHPVVATETPEELVAWRRERLFPCTAHLHIAAFTELAPDQEHDEQDAGGCDVDQLVSNGPRSYANQKLWTELSELYQLKLDGIFASCVADEFYHQVHVQVIDPKAIVSKSAIVCTLDLASMDPEKITSNGIQGNFSMDFFGSVTVSGFAIWFTVHFPDGTNLSTSPYAPSTHWQQCLIYVPQKLEASQSDSVEGTISFTHPFSNKRDLNVLLDCSFLHKASGKPYEHFTRKYHLES